MNTKIRVTRGSGDVFADLQVTEADEALAKAKLAAQIAGAIGQQGLTQTEAADLLEIDQPKVSALLRGRLTGFSTERLIRFLNALGRDVEIVVRPKPRSRARAQLRVISA